MTTVLREADGIEYVILEDKDLDQAFKLVAKVFTSGAEPLTRKLDVDAKGFQRLLMCYGPKFVREGLCIVARDARTGQVAGAHLAEDKGTEPPVLGEECRWAAPVLALLDELDKIQFGDLTVEPGRYAHLFFVAVEPMYRGKRISENLLTLTLELLGDKGYEKAYGEATGVISQHVSLVSGFTICAEIPYTDFLFEGRRPFMDLKDHPSAMLMVMDVPT